MLTVTVWDIHHHWDLVHDPSVATPTSLTPGNYEALLCLYILVILGRLCKWGHTVCNLLRLFFFSTQRSLFWKKLEVGSQSFKITERNRISQMFVCPPYLSFLPKVFGFVFFFSYKICSTSEWKFRFPVLPSPVPSCFSPEAGISVHSVLSLSFITYAAHKLCVCVCAHACA